MTMAKAPYQIVRTETEIGYVYDLWLIDPVTNETLDHVESKVRSNQPIAPAWLRRLQAILNTRIVLDYNGVIPVDLMGRRA